MNHNSLPFFCASITNILQDSFKFTIEELAFVLRQGARAPSSTPRRGRADPVACATDAVEIDTTLQAERPERLDEIQSGGDGSDSSSRAGSSVEPGSHLHTGESRDVLDSNLAETGNDNEGLELIAGWVNQMTQSVVLSILKLSFRYECESNALCISFDDINFQDISKFPLEHNGELAGASNSIEFGSSIDDDTSEDDDDVAVVINKVITFNGPNGRIFRRLPTDEGVPIITTEGSSFFQMMAQISKSDDEVKIRAHMLALAKITFHASLPTLNGLLSCFGYAEPPTTVPSSNRANSEFTAASSGDSSDEDSQYTSCDEEGSDGVATSTPSDSDSVSGAAAASLAAGTETSRLLAEDGSASAGTQQFAESGAAGSSTPNVQKASHRFFDHFQAAIADGSGTKLPAPSPNLVSGTMGAVFQGIVVEYTPSQRARQNPTASPFGWQSCSSTLVLHASNININQTPRDLRSADDRNRQPYALEIPEMYVYERVRMVNLVHHKLILACCDFNQSLTAGSGVQCTFGNSQCETRIYIGPILCAVGRNTATFVSSTVSEALQVSDRIAEKSSKHATVGASSSSTGAAASGGGVSIHNSVSSVIIANDGAQWNCLTPQASSRVASDKAIVVQFCDASCLAASSSLNVECGRATLSFIDSSDCGGFTGAHRELVGDDVIVDVSRVAPTPFEKPTGAGGSEQSFQSNHPQPSAAFSFRSFRTYLGDSECENEPVVFNSLQKAQPLFWCEASNAFERMNIEYQRAADVASAIVNTATSSQRIMLGHVSAVLPSPVVFHELFELVRDWSFVPDFEPTTSVEPRSMTTGGDASKDSSTWTGADMVKTSVCCATMRCHLPAHDGQGAFLLRVNDLHVLACGQALFFGVQEVFLWDYSARSLGMSDMPPSTTLLASIQSDTRFCSEVLVMSPNRNGADERALSGMATFASIISIEVCSGRDMFEWVSRLQTSAQAFDPALTQPSCAEQAASMDEQSSENSNTVRLPEDSKGSTANIFLADATVRFAKSTYTEPQMHGIVSNSHGEILCKRMFTKLSSLVKVVDTLDPNHRTDAVQNHCICSNIVKCHFEELQLRFSSFVPRTAPMTLVTIDMTTLTALSRFNNDIDPNQVNPSKAHRQYFSVRGGTVVVNFVPGALPTLFHFVSSLSPLESRASKSTTRPEEADGKNPGLHPASLPNDVVVSQFFHDDGSLADMSVATSIDLLAEIDFDAYVPAADAVALHASDALSLDFTDLDDFVLSSGEDSSSSVDDLEDWTLVPHFVAHAVSDADSPRHQGGSDVAVDATQQTEAWSGHWFDEPPVIDLSYLPASDPKLPISAHENSFHVSEAKVDSNDLNAALLEIGAVDALLACGDQDFFDLATKATVHAQGGIGNDVHKKSDWLQRIEIVNVGAVVHVVDGPADGHVRAEAHDFPAHPAVDISHAHGDWVCMDGGLWLCENYVDMIMDHVAPLQSQGWVEETTGLVNPADAYGFKNDVCRPYDRLSLSLSGVGIVADILPAWSEQRAAQLPPTDGEPQLKSIAQRLNVCVTSMKVVDSVGGAPERSKSVSRILCVAGSAAPTDEKFAFTAACVGMQPRDSVAGDEDEDSSIIDDAVCRCLDDDDDEQTRGKSKQQGTDSVRAVTSVSSTDSIHDSLVWTVSVHVDPIRLWLRVRAVEFLLSISDQIHNAAPTGPNGRSAVNPAVSPRNAQTSQVLFDSVDISQFNIVVDFLAKRQAYTAALSRLFGMFSSGNGDSDAAVSAKAGAMGHSAAANVSSTSTPSVLYWIPTVRGVKIVVPRSHMDSCIGVSEVFQQWLDTWARYLLREDLFKVGASLAIGLAGYSGADSIDGVQASLKTLKVKLRRLLPPL